jgi:hypothetical protein
MQGRRVGRYGGTRTSRAIERNGKNEWSAASAARRNLRDRRGHHRTQTGRRGIEEAPGAPGGMIGKSSRPLSEDRHRGRHSERVQFAAADRFGVPNRRVDVHALAHRHRNRTGRARRDDSGLAILLLRRSVDDFKGFATTATSRNGNSLIERCQFPTCANGQSQREFDDWAIRSRYEIKWPSVVISLRLLMPFPEFLRSAIL